MLAAYLDTLFIFPVYVGDQFGKAEDIDPLTESLEWRIFESESAYTQVEPPAGWNTLDPVADRIDLGRYRVSWTVPPAANIGEYSIEIRRVSGGSVVKSYREEFEVLTSFIPDLERGLHLCLIRDLRAEGVAVTVTDYKLARAISRGDSFIERYCGRVFQPRYSRFRVVCETSGQIVNPEPLAWLQKVEDSEGTEIALSDITLFSRYLRSIQGAPASDTDDRDFSLIKSSSLYKAQ